MQKKIYIIFCIGLLTACGSPKETVISSSGSKNFENEQVIISFAKEQWNNIVAKIPSGMEEQFGFQNREEIENATFGIPLKMYYWQENAMKESSTYRVPVLVDGKMVSLLTVLADGQIIKTGDFGGSQLAQNIDRISTKYGVKAQGILRAYSKSLDFFVFGEINNFKFIQITSNISDNKILNMNDINEIINK